MVKIGEIEKDSTLVTGAADSEKIKADSPTAGASESRSPLASEGHRSLLEEPGAGKTAPGNTAKEERKGQEEKDESSDTKRDKKEFYQNTIIHQDDVGKNLFDKITETDTSADSVTELSETEVRLLDNMIFKGFVQHKIFIKKGMPAHFRSCPPIAMQHGSELLEEYQTNSKDKLNNLYTCMVIAVYLEEYGIKDNSDNLYFSHKEKSQEDFFSKEAIKERLDFCSTKMNGVLVDILTERLMEFLSLLNRVGKSRNVLNF